MATDRYVTATGTDTYANSTVISTPMSWATMLANAAAGDRINVLAGAYSRTTSIDALTNAGTATSPIIIRGYGSSIGDGNLGRTNGNGPLITTNMPVLTYTTGRLTPGQAFVIYECLSITAAPTSSAATILLGADSVAKTCKFVYSGTSASGTSLSIGTRSIAFDCDASYTGASSGTSAVTCTAASAAVDSCRITSASSSAPGISIASSAVVYGNVIYAASGIGISMGNTAGAPYIRNNTIVGGSSDGINIITATTGLQKIIGNMITDNTGAGINMVSAANCGFLAYNRTRDNSGGGVASGTDWVAATSYGHVTTDTGGSETDYTASGSNDYSLIGASPAIGVSWYLYSDIGALQRIGGGGSSSHAFGG